MTDIRPRRGADCLSRCCGPVLLRGDDQPRSSNTWLSATALKLEDAVLPGGAGSRLVSPGLCKLPLRPVSLLRCTCTPGCPLETLRACGPGGPFYPLKGFYTPADWYIEPPGGQRRSSTTSVCFGAPWDATPAGFGASVSAAEVPGQTGALQRTT